MKKLLAVATIFLVFSASVVPVLAGGAAYHSSQRRARAAADEWKRNMTDKWKKFDAEMSACTKGTGKSTSKPDDKRPGD
ncbi:MAG: hypothetical protein RDU20_11950 [Desulfomonilaceae bacterium]|nr:hypothetical protein [Desulfomonilaceae bacterium]